MPSAPQQATVPLQPPTPQPPCPAAFAAWTPTSGPCRRTAAISCRRRRVTAALSARAYVDTSPSLPTRPAGACRTSSMARYPPRLCPTTVSGPAGNRASRSCAVAARLFSLCGSATNMPCTPPRLRPSARSTGRQSRAVQQSPGRKRSAVLPSSAAQCFPAASSVGTVRSRSHAVRPRVGNRVGGRIHCSTFWLICSTSDFGIIRCNSQYRYRYLSLWS